MSDLPYPENEGQTHYTGCWRDRGHHNCALRMIEELRANSDRYEWLVAQGYFRTFSPDMSGNHVWTGIGRTLPGRGPTISAAIDAARRDQ